MSPSALFSSPTTMTTLLGLHATADGVPPPSYAAHYLIFHFLFAYGVLSTRPWKAYYRLDHQVSPREDLTKYGPAALAAGKITAAQLAQLHRIDACSANSVEHYALLVGGVLLAERAGVGAARINRAGLYYTLARVGYALSYIFIARSKPAAVRGVFWWASNVVCLRLLWEAGRVMNERSAVGI